MPLLPYRVMIRIPLYYGQVCILLVSQKTERAVLSYEHHPIESTSSTN